MQEALDTAKKLITDCETGGGKYNTYMYPSYSEVFKEAITGKTRKRFGNIAGMQEQTVTDQATEITS